VLYVRKIRQGLVPPFVNPVGIEWNMSQYIITVNMRQATCLKDDDIDI